VVEIAGPGRGESPPELPLLYQDGYIIAVNKPAGLVSDQAPHSAEHLLREKLRSPALKAIHRLDKETSGVFLLARDLPTFERYKTIWRAWEVEKIYHAICFNAARFRTRTVSLPVNGKPALSRVILLRGSGGYSYFAIAAHTGRKHQVRLHLQAIRHPVVGDKEYGLKFIADSRIKDIARQLLHCYRISIPALGLRTAPPGRNGLSRLSITAPLPADFRQAGRRLGLLS
jgi:23S rRNA pseudouridine1911/1915/1917 synthase